MIRNLFQEGEDDRMNDGDSGAGQVHQMPLIANRSALGDGVANALHASFSGDIRLEHRQQQEEQQALIDQQQATSHDQYGNRRASLTEPILHNTISETNQEGYDDVDGADTSWININEIQEEEVLNKEAYDIYNDNNNSENGITTSSRNILNDDYHSADDVVSRGCISQCKPFSFMICGGEERLQMRNRHLSFMKQYGSDMDSSLGNYMNEETKILDQLSDIDKQQIFRELSGISRLNGEMSLETPELIHGALHGLSTELCRLVAANKSYGSSTAYEIAWKKNSDYCRSLWLAHLRCEDYNCKKAATRIMSFFEEKLTYFGPDVLTRHITLDDLDPKTEQIILSCGSFVAPTMKTATDTNNGDFNLTAPLTDMVDSYGRQIYITFPHLRPSFEVVSTENLMRAIFFQYQQCSINTDSASNPNSALVEHLQRHGIIYIVHLVNQSPLTVLSNYDMRNEAFLMSRLLYSMPVKIISSHFNINDPRLRTAIAWRNLLNMDAPKRQAVEFVHYGTHVECTYKLMKEFHIPSDLLTSIIDLGTGDVNPARSIKWLQDQQHIQQKVSVSESSLRLAEEVQPQQSCSSSSSMHPPQSQHLQQQSQKGGIAASCPGSELEPSKHDVVFGKGHKNQNRPGNMRYRLVIDMHLDRYSNARSIQAMKRRIFDDVIKVIKEDSKGRFLKPAASGHGWEEVTDTVEIRNKVSASFRQHYAKKQEQLRKD